MDGHTRIPDILLVSTKVWNRLDPQLQQWVQQAASESSAYQRELWQEMTVEAMEKAKEEGVTIYDVDTAAFAATVAPMVENISNAEVRTLHSQIAAVAEYDTKQQSNTNPATKESVKE